MLSSQGGGLSEGEGGFLLTFLLTLDLRTRARRPPFACVKSLFLLDSQAVFGGSFGVVFGGSFGACDLSNPPLRLDSKRFLAVLFGVVFGPVFARREAFASNKSLISLDSEVAFDGSLGAPFSPPSRPDSARFPARVRISTSSLEHRLLTIRPFSTAIFPAAIRRRLMPTHLLG